MIGNASSNCICGAPCRIKSSRKEPEEISEIMVCKPDSSWWYLLHHVEVSSVALCFIVFC